MNSLYRYVIVLLFAAAIILPPASRVEAGLEMIKDINIGSAPSYPDSLTSIGGIFFFAADDGSHGWELWRSDGTAAGTFMVKDIYPGADDTVPLHLEVVNGILYFKADDGVHGQELWRSDGTAAGTLMVKDIVPGPDPSGPWHFTPAGDALYFTAGGDVHIGWEATGNELWRSDGTEAGTIRVADLPPAAPGRNRLVFGLTDVDGTLYFSMQLDSRIYELWRSDGTEAGTSRIRSFQFLDVVWEESWIAMDGVLYFSGDGELWRSDGTEAGTYQVREINPGEKSSHPSKFHEVNGAIYFEARVGDESRKLWRSDGTEDGTYRVSRSDVWICSDIGVMDGILYFCGTTDYYDHEIWRSDGTDNGTFKLKDIYPGVYGSIPRYFNVMNDRIYFTAADDVHGTELWRSDGTPGGTNMVMDGIPGPEGLLDDDYFPLYFADICGALFFGADDGVHGAELWKYEPYSSLLIDIKANGEEGLTTHDNAAGKLSLSVALDPLKAAGVEADWWLRATSPQGRQVWYVPGKGWVPSKSPLRAHGGPLTAVEAVRVLTTDHLPVGEWRIDFAVDPMDGNAQWTVCDTVGVVVMP